MERRGGCCIARYGGGADVAWRVGRIMLRYRPIAPKPTAMASSVPATSDPKPVTSSGRNKRKPGACTGTGKRGRKPKKQMKAVSPDQVREEKCSSSSSSSGTTSIDSSSLVTLPLMPQSPEGKTKLEVIIPPAVLVHTPSPVLVPRPVRPVGSCVTLEGLSNVWREGREVAPMPNMVTDEAPAFVSDGWGRVTWTNEAYQTMVTDDGDGEKEEVRVGLVTRGLVPVWGTCYGYTCRVRARYACKKKGRVSLAAPCDVWRVEGGCYAWRLDIKAALSLSLTLCLS